MRKFLGHGGHRLIYDFYISTWLWSFNRHVTNRPKMQDRYIAQCFNMKKLFIESTPIKSTDIKV